MVRSKVVLRSRFLSEARTLADQGCLEITLLGQTVNSYQYRAGGETTRLADLLVRLHDIEGIERLKFVTNFPKDMTTSLLLAVRDLPEVFSLPACAVAEWFERDPQADEAGLHGGRVSRHDGARFARRFREPRYRAISLSVSVVRPMRISSRRLPRSRNFVSRTASFSSTASGRGPRRPAAWPTMCPTT